MAAKLAAKKSKKPVVLSDSELKNRVGELKALYGEERIMAFLRKVEAFVYGYKEGVGIEGTHIGLMAQVRLLLHFNFILFV